MSAMEDKNGAEVRPGDAVKFYFFGRWRKGFVRRLTQTSTGDVVAHVDDGAVDNADLNTNGSHVAAMVPAKDLEVLRVAA
jgi:hypothetical protein